VHIGIDLGTTYSCCAYIDEQGKPCVIPTAEGDLTTPSVIWFDGKTAEVGKRANARKLSSPALHVYEFVKRNMGKPVEVPPNLFADDDPAMPVTAPYEIGGFRYGAAGMSAIILRKLKRDAVRWLKRQKKLDPAIDERQLELDAVITVPAYFGDKERQETKLAGYAAGLNVIGIINEPTAAALSYGLMNHPNARIMVFDLGGGTFDVTILEMTENDAVVLGSRGHSALGGRDWDRLIEEYLYEAVSSRTGRSMPETAGFEVQQRALAAKHELSEAAETTVFLNVDGIDVDLRLFRERPPDAGDELDMTNDRASSEFYFEERSLDLLTQCRVLCEAVLNSVQLAESWGGRRPMAWAGLDEIILAGGSCRMPMVAKMLERLSGRKVRRQIAGFDFDTAIATGAALYGKHRQRVQDVVSHSIGVKVMQEGRLFIEHLLLKDQRLPAEVEKVYRAGPRAVLWVYEGQSTSPDECVLRGRLELDNGEGNVTIAMVIDGNGILTVTADYPPHGKQLVELRNELFALGPRVLPLREKVQAIVLNS
jgi:molecular chaperone DnaK